MLVLPATVAAVFACRDEAAARVAAGGRPSSSGCALLVAAAVRCRCSLAFVAASPFVVLDAPHFLGDFRRQSQIMDRGWLGFEHVGNGFWYNVTPNLTGAIGVVLVVLGAAGLVWALWRRTRLDLMIAPYVIVYFVYIGTWKELADRYLLVIVPLVLLLAMRLCVDVVGLVRPGLRRIAVPVVAVVLAVAFVSPLASSLAFDRGLSGADTREVAREWIQRNVPAGSLIAVENYGPPLVREDELDHYRASRSRPGRLPPGPAQVAGARRAGPRARSRRGCAEQGVEYVVVSSPVRDRVLAAPDVYPSIVEFYRRLDAEADW